MVLRGNGKIYEIWASFDKKILYDAKFELIWKVIPIRKYMEIKEEDKQELEIFLKNFFVDEVVGELNAKRKDFFEAVTEDGEYDHLFSPDVYEKIRKGEVSTCPLEGEEIPSHFHKNLIAIEPLTISGYCVKIPLNEIDVKTASKLIEAIEAYRNGDIKLPMDDCDIQFSYDHKNIEFVFPCYVRILAIKKDLS